MERNRAWNQLSTRAELPLVSIVTPTYQGARYIEESIRSVQAQTYPHIEYIVMDGGSTDETASIAARYEDVISRFVSEPDNGQADAIRRGFELANGTVLAWLNADDVYEPDAVAKAVSKLQESNADIAYGDMNLIDAVGSKVGERRVSPLPRFGQMQGLISGSLGIYQPAAFWSADLYRRVGGVDARIQFAMDTDLVVKFAGSRAKFVHIDGPLVNFRVHSDSKTSTLQHVSDDDRARLVDRWPARNAVYRYSVDIYARLWKLGYLVGKGRFRYLFRRYFDSRYRFVP